MAIAGFHPLPSMNPKLYAPTLSLFAFHLRNRRPSPEPSPAHPLWQQCDRLLERLQIPDLRLVEPPTPETESDTPPSDRSAFSPETDFSIPFASEISLDDRELGISGTLSWQGIRDSHALILEICPQDRDRLEIPPSALASFNPDNVLQFPASDRSLGQTLLICLPLAESPDPHPSHTLKNLADSCLHALIPDPELSPPFHRKGELLGSPIFEYAAFDDPTVYPHLLLWFCDRERAETPIATLHPYFTELFYFWNKAVKAYKITRTLYLSLYQSSQKIERILDNCFVNLASESEIVGVHLPSLKTQLTTLTKLGLEYSRLLRDLEYYQAAIATNAKHYAETLTESETTKEWSFSFLEQFNQRSCPQFIEQIQSELNYFRHSDRGLEKGISAIHAAIAIEQAQTQRSLQAQIVAKKLADEQSDRAFHRRLQRRELARKRRDRSLQTIVLVLGTGIGIGAIVASSSTLTGFLLSLLATGIIGALTWGLTRLFYQRLDTPKPQTPLPEQSKD